MENGNPKPRLLCGWKEIAAYLGISVRTAQRYWCAWGLPVRKAANTKRGAVFATTDELDAWVETRPRPILPSSIETTIHEVHEFSSQLQVLHIESRRLLTDLKENVARFQKIMSPPPLPIWHHPAKRITHHRIPQVASA